METSARIPMARRKRIALIAHDNTKADLIEWIAFSKGLLALMDDAYQRLVPPYDGTPEIAPAPPPISVDV